MLLKDLKVGLENIVADPTKSTVDVVSARTDTDKNSVITGVRLEICTRRGSRNPVKLPLTDGNRAAMEQVAKLLQKNDTVSVLLAEPVVRPYAMISNGNLISGISIKADSFTLVDDEADLL